MRYVAFELDGKAMLGVRAGAQIHVIGHVALEDLLACGVDLTTYGKTALGGPALDAAGLRFLPPLRRPPKILCIGLNYADHTRESNLAQPDYPTVFLRVPTSLVAHDQPIVRPRASDSLDFEGELAVILGKGGRHLARADALSCVAGYALFNDASIREYQFKSSQWTIGKNFDATGAFGPDLVTTDELPPGARGLRLETRLNGEVVQSATTADMIFDVASLVAILSEAITLEPGDVIVSGTPAGVGWARSPRLLMQPGDVCEVTVERLGTLRNAIAAEPPR